MSVAQCVHSMCPSKIFYLLSPIVFCSSLQFIDDANKPFIKHGIFGLLVSVHLTVTTLPTPHLVLSWQGLSPSAFFYLWLYLKRWHKNLILGGGGSRGLCFASRNWQTYWEVQSDLCLDSPTVTSSLTWWLQLKKKRLFMLISWDAALSALRSLHSCVKILLCEEAAFYFASMGIFTMLPLYARQTYLNWKWHKILFYAALNSRCSFAHANRSNSCQKMGRKAEKEKLGSLFCFNHTV